MRPDPSVYAGSSESIHFWRRAEGSEWQPDETIRGIAVLVSRRLPCYA